MTNHCNQQKHHDTYNEDKSKLINHTIEKIFAKAAEEEH